MLYGYNTSNSFRDWSFRDKHHTQFQHLVFLKSLSEAFQKLQWDQHHFFTKMQLDHGWKNFSSTPQHLQPEVGRVLVRAEGKSIIEEIQKYGKNFRLSVHGETKKIIFNPEAMQIEEPE